MFLFRQSASWLLAVSLLLLPFSSLCFTGVFKEDMGLFPVLVLVGVWLALFLCLSSTARVKISVVDAAAGVFGLYYLVRLAGGTVDALAWLQVALWAGVYVAARCCGSVRTVLWGLVLSAAVQAGVVMAQQAGWVASRHPLFDVSGTFGNPGQVGGFMAVAAAAVLAQVVGGWRNRFRSVRPVVAGVLGAMLLAGLWLADSRAAWLACLSGVAFAVLGIAGGRLGRWKGWLLACAVPVLLAAAWLVYRYRPLSADARLLIGRVSLDMLADAPLWGHGTDAFARQYMFYQADYFARHPDSPFALVADNVGVAYNEWLHAGVALGLVGMLLVLFPVAALLLHRPRHADGRSAGAALVALLVFSLFSYPLDVLPLAVLFPLLAGLGRGRVCVVLPLRRSVRRFLGVACLLGCVAVGRLGLFYADASRQTQALHGVGGMDRAVVERLLPNPSFADYYAHYVRLCGLAVDDSSLGALLPPSCELFCHYGDLHLQRGRYAEAERCYCMASHMIPTRLTPVYKLWKLSLVQADSASAIAWARRVCAHRVKVENTFTLRARAEARRYLSQPARPPVSSGTGSEPLSY